MASTSVNGLRGRIWLDGRARAGWLTWAKGRVERVEAGEPPRNLRRVLPELGSSILLPGFVDTLLHGYGGIDCADGNAQQLHRMSLALAATGVTTALAGFYPGPLEDLRKASRRWDNWQKLRGAPRTRIPGWHVEGPFIAPEMRGALPRKGILKPSAENAARTLRACGGWLRMSTLAPELSGCAEAAEELRSAGVMASVGHSAATRLDCEALAAIGPVAMTHLGNRMSGLSAREPGPIGFAMEGGAKHVAVIPDMVHVAPETLRLWAGTRAMRDSLSACSDNLSHAGLLAEDFRAGGQRLSRSGAVAVDKDGGLAGTLDSLPEMLLRCVRDGYLSLADAVRLGCTNPGRVFEDCGRIEVGMRADFVSLLDDRTVGKVWIGGRPVRGT